MNGHSCGVSPPRTAVKIHAILVIRAHGRSYHSNRWDISPARWLARLLCGADVGKRRTEKSRLLPVCLG